MPRNFVSALQLPGLLPCSGLPGSVRGVAPAMRVAALLLGPRAWAALPAWTADGFAGAVAAAEFSAVAFLAEWCAGATGRQS